MWTPGAQLIHAVALVTQNHDVNVDNILVRLTEDTCPEVDRLVLVDCERSFLAHSPVIEELEEQYALSRWAGFDQCFCREARGRLLTAELQATCATLAKAKVISWSAAFFTAVSMMYMQKKLGSEPKMTMRELTHLLVRENAGEESPLENELLAVIDIGEAATDVGPSQQSSDVSTPSPSPQAKKARIVPTLPTSRPRPGQPTVLIEGDSVNLKREFRVLLDPNLRRNQTLNPNFGFS